MDVTMTMQQRYTEKKEDVKWNEEQGEKEKEGETKTVNQIYVLLYKGRRSETQLKRERK